MPWHNLLMSGFFSAKHFMVDRTPGYLVKRCSVLMTDLAERTFDERGMSFTQWVVLMNLRRSEPISVGELARTLGHDQGALTRVVDALVQADKVERRRCATDRRSVEISLTDTGRSYVEEQLPFVIDALNHLFEPFEKKEVDAMVDLLTRLLERLTEVKAEKVAQDTRQAPSS